MNENDGLYSLEELIEKLENIKNDGEGSLNFPKAFYCLALEIKALVEYKQYAHEIIPIKYRKFNPKPNENPFFSLNDYQKDYKEAKERMMNLSKQATSEDSSVSEDQHNPLP